jgi:hypothetical protein
MEELRSDRETLEAMLAALGRHEQAVARAAGVPLALP